MAIALLSIQAVRAGSVQKIVTNPAFFQSDPRQVYPLTLLRKILDTTQADFGAYELIPYDVKVSRDRALQKLVAGEINVYSSPGQPQWTESSLKVEFPVRKGLLGYRLFLIRHGDQNHFAKIRTLDDLKGYRLGQGRQWSSTRIFKAHGFKAIGEVNYTALFDMLSNGRFDYFPRGINEIFDEYALKTNTHSNLMIEPTLALHMPIATFFHVSPKQLALFERINIGFKDLIKSGEFEILFNKFHHDDIEAANIKSRRVLYLSGSSFPKVEGFEESDIWYRP